MRINNLNHRKMRPKVDLVLNFFSVFLFRVFPKLLAHLFSFFQPSAHWPKQNRKRIKRALIGLKSVNFLRYFLLDEFFYWRHSDKFCPKNHLWYDFPESGHKCFWAWQLPRKTVASTRQNSYKHFALKTLRLCEVICACKRNCNEV